MTSNVLTLQSLASNFSPARYTVEHGSVDVNINVRTVSHDRHHRPQHGGPPRLSLEDRRTLDLIQSDDRSCWFSLRGDEAGPYDHLLMRDISKLGLPDKNYADFQEDILRGANREDCDWVRRDTNAPWDVQRAELLKRFDKPIEVSLAFFAPSDDGKHGIVMTGTATLLVGFNFDNDTYFPETWNLNEEVEGRRPIGPYYNRSTCALESRLSFRLLDGTTLELHAIPRRYFVHIYPRESLSTVEPVQREHIILEDDHMRDRGVPESDIVRKHPRGDYNYIHYHIDWTTPVAIHPISLLTKPYKCRQNPIVAQVLSDRKLKLHAESTADSASLQFERNKRDVVLKVGSQHGFSMTAILSHDSFIPKTKKDTLAGPPTILPGLYVLPHSQLLLLYSSEYNYSLNDPGDKRGSVQKGKLNNETAFIIRGETIIDIGAARENDNRDLESPVTLHITSNDLLVKNRELHIHGFIQHSVFVGNRTQTLDDNSTSYRTNSDNGTDALLSHDIEDNREGEWEPMAVYKYTRGRGANEHEGVLEALLYSLGPLETGKRPLETGRRPLESGSGLLESGRRPATSFSSRMLRNILSGRR